MIDTKLLNITDNDSFLVRCFKSYCCKTTAITETIYEANSKDRNDYKIVAALGYLLISDKKWEHIQNDFNDGVARISKKDIKSSTLIYDQLSLVGIVVAIKKYQIKEYYQWVESILFESEAYCIKSSKESIFTRILKAYFADQSYPANVQTKDNVLINWLLSLSDIKRDTYKEQAELFQEAWKCDEYLFDEILYNGLCAYIIDLLIEDKFEYGLISVEQKYKNAVTRCKSIAKGWAIVITTILILTVVFVTAFLSYLAWNYEVFTNGAMWLLPLIIDILTVAGISFGIIKKGKLIYAFFKTELQSHIIKSRRLD